MKVRSVIQAVTSPPGDSVTRNLTAANALTIFVLWLLQKYVFKADIPSPVQGVVVLAVSGAVSYGSSFLLYYQKRIHGNLPPAPPQSLGPGTHTGWR